MTVLSRFILIVTAVTGARLAQTGQRPALASMLEPGFQLVYASNGAESPPWVIDSVVRDVSLGGRTGCVRLRLRTNPTQAVASTRIHCVESMTMLNWDSLPKVWRPARPLGANSALDLPLPGGGRNRFEAGHPTMEKIVVERGATRDSVTVEVIPTTLTTFDSTGKAIRRLRERFSVALATASGGVFEVVDSTQAGGWRLNQTFDLVLLRQP